MSHPTLQERVSALVDAIESPRGESRRIDYWTLVYTTTGGSRMVASTPETNDDGRAHDLVLVHPAKLHGEHVVPLRPTVDPEWLHALRDALAARRFAAVIGSGGVTMETQPVKEYGSATHPLAIPNRVRVEAGTPANDRRVTDRRSDAMVTVTASAWASVVVTLTPDEARAFAADIIAAADACDAPYRHDVGCMNGPNCRMRDWHIRNDFGGL